MYPESNHLAYGIYIVFFVGMISLFIYLIYRRITVIRKGEPKNRYDQIGKRLWLTIKVVLGQTRILNPRFWDGGIAHAFIFWGFVVLLINSANVIIGGLIPGFHFPFLGPGTKTLTVYNYMRDIFEIIVTVMVLYAFFRRLVLKPKRLTINWEGYLILTFILLIMLSDFFMNGAEWVLHGPALSNASIMHHWMGSWFNAGSMSAATATAIFHIGWWTHAAVVLIFLNFLPVSKHFHVLTAPFNVFFQNLEIGPLSTLDIENAEHYGASKIHHFAWKDILDVYTCTECGRCQSVCPAYNTGKLLTPKGINEDMRHYINENMDDLVKHSRQELDELELKHDPLIGSVISEEVLWACTTCRACEEACPLTIEFVERIVDMRRSLVLEESKFPNELQAAFNGMERNGNPWNINEDRLAWVKEEPDLQVKTVEENPDFEILYWVGCAGAFDQKGQKIARSFTRILNKANVNFAVLGNQEQCTGDSARRAGNEYLFSMMAEQNVETLNNAGVKKIVTTCPHCLNTLKNEYPQFGGNYEVIHHTQFINQLISEGKIKLSDNGEHKKLTYHDPCYLGRYNGEFEAPREVLQNIKGLELTEMKNSRQASFCCGAGGAQMWKEEEKGKQPVRQARMQQAVDVHAEEIATACPFCLTMLTDASNEMETNVAVRDLAEIVAERLV